MGALLCPLSGNLGELLHIDNNSKHLLAINTLQLLFQVLYIF